VLDLIHHIISLGLDDSFETPMHALHHILEWMSTAFATLNAVRNSRSGFNPNHEIDEIIKQLIEV
jgi:hypothetical protein